MVSLRKERGMTQADVAQAMGTTRSAVASLEKRLLSGACVSEFALKKYAAAVDLTNERTGKPGKTRYGIFPDPEAAIAEAVHTSACEGRTVPPEEINNLRKVVRGEISREELIRKYVDEALAKQEARDRKRKRKG